MKSTNMNDRVRSEMVAERVKFIFGFVMTLAEDKNLLDEARDVAAKRAENASTLAPISTAMGLDWQRAEMEAKLRTERAKALINLIDVLVETEERRTKFNEREAGMSANRDELARMLGL